MRKPWGSTERLCGAFVQELAVIGGNELSPTEDTDWHSRVCLIHDDQFVNARDDHLVDGGIEVFMRGDRWRITGQFFRDDETVNESRLAYGTTQVFAVNHANELTFRVNNGEAGVCFEVANFSSNS